MSLNVLGDALSADVWLVLALIGAGAVLALLGHLAGCIEDGKRLHDATVEAEHLRQRYAAQLAEERHNAIVGPEVSSRLSGREAA